MIWGILKAAAMILIGAVIAGSVCFALGMLWISH